MLRSGVDLPQARADLANQYGILPSDGPPPARSPGPAKTSEPETAASSAIPSDALASRPKAHRTLGQPTAVWEYTSAEGQPWAWVYRFDPPNREKLFQPLSYQDGKWTWKAPSGKRPLYGLARLLAQPDAPLVIAEGEKSADAAGRLKPNHVGITSWGGSSAANKTDWSHLKGRHVRIWPDADPAGASYAKTVAEIATKAGATQVEILDLASLAIDPATGAPRELPSKWDAANAEGDGWTPQLLETSARWISQQPRKKATASGQYKVTDAGWTVLVSDDEEHPRPLANFHAHITEEVERDDGAERSLRWTIEGKVGRETLWPVTIPVGDFSGLAWVTREWGSRCLIRPGANTKEHLRYAIQLLSNTPDPVPRRVEYAHVGWRDLGAGHQVYLSAGTVMGPQGPERQIHVQLGEDLNPLYQLPEPSPTDTARQEAARASLALLDLARQTITVPLLSAAWLAPLSQAIGVDFALWLEGPSQSKKSSLAAVMAAHFGPRIERTSLPASFKDTANTINLKLFVLADSLVVVDDYAPQPSASEQSQMDKTVHDVVRGIGNRSARGRMTRDIQLRANRPPRGLVVMTAEQWPSGESITARLFGVSIQPGDVDTARLSTAQAQALDGLLARAMCDHIQRMARDLENHRTRAREVRDRYRAMAFEAQLSGRIPDQIALLMTGFYELLGHACAVGILTRDELDRKATAAWRDLLKLARDHKGRIIAAQPADTFKNAIVALLASGRAHLADRITEGSPTDGSRFGWRANMPQGDRLGWVDEAERQILLQPEAAYRAAAEFARHSDTPMGIKPQALFRQLRDRGFILSGTAEKRPDGSTIHRSARKVRIGQSTVGVLVADITAWFDDPAETSGQGWGV